MGMLINGRWSDEDQVIVDGRYERATSVFAKEISPDIIHAMAMEPDRFHLIGSNSCQWCHRTMIFRQIKGLANLISLHIAFGPRVEGYALNGVALWAIPGTDKEITHLHQLYNHSDPAYTGRVTVPVLWDSIQGEIVSNESSQIMKAFDKVSNNGEYPDFALTCAVKHQDAEQIIKTIYDGLNNGVYRAGFAETQVAYDEAVLDVFATLDLLEGRLSRQRYLLGSMISEADWRLFPTLFRFDAIFYTEHRCRLRRLVDYPNVWAYTRDLYAWKGIAQTVTFEDMYAASHAVDFGGGKQGIVTIAPDINWQAPHGRASFGPAEITLRDGSLVVVEPEAMSIAG